MMCCNPKFRAGSNLSFFGLGQIGISQILLLMTSFELFFSKLSENPKKFDIGSTEFKLWQPKESLNH